MVVRILSTVLVNKEIITVNGGEVKNNNQLVKGASKTGSG
jgi:hypothetical protein